VAGKTYAELKEWALRERRRWVESPPRLVGSERDRILFERAKKKMFANLKKWGERCYHHDMLKKPKIEYAVGDTAVFIATPHTFEFNGLAYYEGDPSFTPLVVFAALQKFKELRAAREKINK